MEVQRERKKMRNGVISVTEWENGSSSANNTEKVTKVLSFLESLEKGAGANMKAIAVGAEVKWPYGTVKGLVKGGQVEESKIGKAKYYRVS